MADRRVGLHDKKSPWLQDEVLKGVAMCGRLVGNGVISEVYCAETSGDVLTSETTIGRISSAYLSMSFSAEHRPLHLLSPGTACFSTTQALHMSPNPLFMLPHTHLVSSSRKPVLNVLIVVSIQCVAAELLISYTFPRSNHSHAVCKPHAKDVSQSPHGSRLVTCFSIARQRGIGKTHQ
jgi:hypothetical protein